MCVLSRLKSLPAFVISPQIEASAPKGTATKIWLQSVHMLQGLCVWRCTQKTSPISLLLLLPPGLKLRIHLVASGDSYACPGERWEVTLGCWNLCLSEGRAIRAQSCHWGRGHWMGTSPRRVPSVPKASPAIPDCLGGAQLSLTGTKSLK